MKRSALIVLFVLGIFLVPLVAKADVYIFGRVEAYTAGTGHVWRFDANGNYISTFTVVVDSSSTLGNIAVGPDRNLYVGSGGRVTEYTPDGTFLRTVINNRDVVGYIGGIEIAQDNSIYLSTFTTKLTHLAPDGSLLATYAAPAPVSGLAVDAEGRVYSATNTTGNPTMLRWSAAGGAPDLVLPWNHETYDMEVDPARGELYVLGEPAGSSRMDFRMFVYDLDGNYKRTVSASSYGVNLDYDPQLGHLFIGDTGGFMSPSIMREITADGVLINTYTHDDIWAIFGVAGAPEPCSAALLALGALALLRRDKRA